jgi:hypothetical protein
MRLDGAPYPSRPSENYFPTSISLGGRRAAAYFLQFGGEDGQ